jgi:hypothetical protein
VSHHGCALFCILAAILIEIAGVVVAFAVGAAVYSSGRHFFVDKTIRLKRQNRAADAHAHQEEHH